MTFSNVALTLIEVNAVIVIIILILEERDPSVTLAWAFALLLLPGLGLVAYLIFGIDHRLLARLDRTRRDAHARGEAVIRPIYARFADAAVREMASRPRIAGRVASAIERQCGTGVLPCEDLEILTTGTAKFDRLLEDIRAARESVHLQFFIWESDELTARFCDLLREKVAEGVEVRVLYDWIGSIGYGKKQLRTLRAAGGRVRTDRPGPQWLNFRDHRKIAVIDGRIAYTGGMNMGQEYADGGPHYESWRDTDCRFTGPLVADMQRMFASRWYRLTREDLFGERYFPRLELTSEHPVWSQLAFSGPETEWPAVRNAFLLCILGAERSLRIQSPYFVPDEAVMEALVAQSLSGVDVTLMMTGVPDKKAAWYAAFSYIDELVRAGGRMLQYTAGFFHPKTLTVDRSLAAIGTTNLDIRSFRLHDELTLFFYDADVARELDDVFDRDATRSAEIDISFYEGMGYGVRLRNAFMRLWSRLL